MIDAMNFVRPISRCDIQENPSVVKIHCSGKHEKKSLRVRSFYYVVDNKNFLCNTSGFFWRY